MPALRRAMAYLRPYWRVSLGAFLSLLIVTATSLISPQILRYAIDSGIAGRNPQTLLWACLGLVGVAALRNLFTFTQTYWIEQAGQGVAFTMRSARKQEPLWEGIVERVRGAAPANQTRSEEIQRPRSAKL